MSDFNETWIFPRQFFEKYSYIKFYENPSSGSRVDPWGQTGRPDEGNSHFTEVLCERNKMTNCASN